MGSGERIASLLSSLRLESPTPATVRSVVPFTHGAYATFDEQWPFRASNIYRRDGPVRGGWLFRGHSGLLSAGAERAGRISETGAAKDVARNHGGRVITRGNRAVKTSERKRGRETERERDEKTRSCRAIASLSCLSASWTTYTDLT